MTGHCRPVAVLGLLLLLGGGPADGAQGGSAAGYYYPGISDQPGDVFGGQQGVGGGSYRPSDSPSGTWQGSTGSRTGGFGAPASLGAGGSSGWNSQPYSYRGESSSGEFSRPPADYRFRQRPEDKLKKPDEGPRYRPDPELTRRSQQFWGVPGQDPAQFGDGPAPVFRPLRPEPEKPGRSAPAGQYRGDPAAGSWSGYPSAYGYPY